MKQSRKGSRNAAKKVREAVSGLARTAVYNTRGAAKKLLMAHHDSETSQDMATKMTASGDIEQVNGPSNQVSEQDTQKNRPSRLLALPQELKLIIAGYALYEPGKIVVRAREGESTNGSPVKAVVVEDFKERSVDLSLLKVCKDFYRDFKFEFIKVNHFEFDNPGAMRSFNQYFPGASYRHLTYLVREDMNFLNIPPANLKLIGPPAKQSSMPSEYQSLKTISLRFTVTFSRTTRPEAGYEQWRSDAEQMAKLTTQFQRLQALEVNIEVAPYIDGEEMDEETRESSLGTMRELSKQLAEAYNQSLKKQNKKNPRSARNTPLQLNVVCSAKAVQ